MGSRAAAWMLVGVVLLGSAGARAEGDNRPQDRFYFGVHAGMASFATEAMQTPAIDDPASAFALETGLWPNDYLGFGWGYDVAALSGAETTGLGGYAVGALPLRYVQPYAGVWIGLRHRKLGDTGEIDARVHPLVGLNGYINRNTRLFVQAQYVDLDADADLHAQMITAGVRWSPDAFHRLRGAGKFQVVWLSLLTTGAAFVLTKHAMGGDWL